MKMMERKKRMMVPGRMMLGMMMFGMMMLLLLTGCSGHEKDKLVIGHQFGVAYAPLYIMKEQQLLEKRMPGVTISYEQFGGPTAIREGMVSGDIDVGFMGISPVLVGIDNGMPWRYLTGLSSNRVAVVSKNPQMHSLQDVTDTDRIAILSPGCTQHVLLSVLAKKQLGQARILDSQLVSMTHPDATNAMLSDTEITMHVITPPYLEQELAAGMHLVADGEEIMGEPFTFICGVAMEEDMEQDPARMALFMEALQEATDYINNHMEEACEILAPVYGITKEELKEQMTYNGTIYSTKLQGIEAMSEAMAQTGFIKTQPEEARLFFAEEIRAGNNDDQTKTE